MYSCEVHVRVEHGCVNVNVFYRYMYYKLTLFFRTLMHASDKTQCSQQSRSKIKRALIHLDQFLISFSGPRTGSWISSFQSCNWYSRRNRKRRSPRNSHRWYARHVAMVPSAFLGHNLVRSNFPHIFRFRLLLHICILCAE